MQLQNCEHMITLTLFRRPDYTRQVLEHLSRCAGIQKYHVLIFCEPDCDEVIRLAKRWDFQAKHVVVNHTRLGCTANIYQALATGFSHCQFVIMLEDDILLASDALIWFEFCCQRFRNDHDVWTVSAYNRQQVTPEKYNAYFRKQWFTPWGWATWRDRFAEMSRGWGWESQYSWDCTVNHNLRGNRCEILPYLARAQNVGGEMGTYCPGPEWHRENQLNEFCAGMDGIQLESHSDYREIPLS
jgi:hypothetical protein